MKEANKCIYYKDEEENPRVVPKIKEPVDSTSRVTNQQSTYNRLIHSKVTL